MESLHTVKHFGRIEHYGEGGLGRRECCAMRDVHCRGWCLVPVFCWASQELESAAKSHALTLNSLTIGGLRKSVLSNVRNLLQDNDIAMTVRQGSSNTSKQQAKTANAP